MEDGPPEKHYAYRTRQSFIQKLELFVLLLDKENLRLTQGSALGKSVVLCPYQAMNFLCV